MYTTEDYTSLPGDPELLVRLLALDERRELVLESILELLIEDHVRPARLVDRFVERGTGTPFGLVEYKDRLRGGVREDRDRKEETTGEAVGRRDEVLLLFELIAVLPPLCSSAISLEMQDQDVQQR